jgi:hypothetical protein
MNIGICAMIHYGEEGDLYPQDAKQVSTKVSKDEFGLGLSQFNQRLLRANKQIRHTAHYTLEIDFLLD